MFYRLFLSVLLAFMTVGCATTQLPSNLSSAILDSDDLNTVRDGLPSYLLMVDALVKTYPKNESMHLTAASLNSAYAGVFISPQQAERKKNMSKKALDYAFSAICLHNKDACELALADSKDFSQMLNQFDQQKDLPFLYALGTAWASYIQANSDDWLVVAQLGKAESVLRQVISIDQGYEKGTALLYLGVMNSILPPSLGGKPDVAEQFFEDALKAGNEENLIIYVYYASNYARLLFDQPLHDQLLKQALSLDPYVEGYTLQNIYAKQLAEALLLSSSDYF